MEIRLKTNHLLNVNASLVSMSSRIILKPLAITIARRILKEWILKIASAKKVSNLWVDPNHSAKLFVETILQTNPTISMSVNARKNTISSLILKLFVKFNALNSPKKSIWQNVIAFKDTDLYKVLKANVNSLVGYSLQILVLINVHARQDINQFLQLNVKLYVKKTLFKIPNLPVSVKKDLNLLKVLRESAKSSVDPTQRT